MAAVRYSGTLPAGGAVEFEVENGVIKAVDENGNMSDVKVDTDTAARITGAVAIRDAHTALTDALQQAGLWVDVTDHALDCLDDQSRQLLHFMYVTGQWGSATQVAREMGIERSSVYRRRDEALRKFTVALYGKC